MTTHPRPMYFDYGHLPEGRLRNTSKLFHDFAKEIEAEFDGWDADANEYAMGMRKLLEAKDCFVRSVLPP